jgi:hypothetical protein
MFLKCIIYLSEGKLFSPCVPGRKDSDLSLIMVLFLMHGSQTALKIIAEESGSELVRHHHLVSATSVVCGR